MTERHNATVDAALHVACDAITRRARVLGQDPEIQAVLLLIAARLEPKMFSAIEIDLAIREARIGWAKSK